MTHELAELRSWSLPQVQAWVAGDPGDAPWLGLYEMSRARGQDDQLDDASRLAWLDLGRLFLRLWARHDPESADSAVMNEISLRCYAIRLYGPGPSYEVLAAEDLWPLVNGTLAAAAPPDRERADRWRELPVEEVRRLRKVKNVLALVELLPEAVLQAAPGRLDLPGWLALRPHLP